jgi:hypothetical protein
MTPTVNTSAGSTSATVTPPSPPKMVMTTRTTSNAIRPQIHTGDSLVNGASNAPLDTVQDAGPQQGPRSTRDALRAGVEPTVGSEQIAE